MFLITLPGLSWCDSAKDKMRGRLLQITKSHDISCIFIRDGTTRKTGSVQTTVTTDQTLNDTAWHTFLCQFKPGIVWYTHLLALGIHWGLDSVLDTPYTPSLRVYWGVKTDLTTRDHFMAGSPEWKPIKIAVCLPLLNLDKKACGLPQSSLACLYLTASMNERFFYMHPWAVGL